MVFVTDLTRVDKRSQKLLLAFQLRYTVLRAPLKRCERLRYEAGNAYRNVHTLARALFRIVFIHYPFAQSGDPGDILIRFGGEPVHKIKLHARSAAVERLSARGKYLFLRDIFVYNIAQALCPRLRSEGKPTFADRGHLFEQFFIKAIDTHGGQRKIHLFFIRPGKQLFDKLRQTGVIAYGKRGERNFGISAVFYRFPCIRIQRFR